MISFVSLASFSSPLDAGISEWLGDLERGGTEIALADVSGTLIVLLYDDGEYLFSLPDPPADKTALARALDALDEYTVRLELPLVLLDFPAASLPLLTARYPDLTAEAVDDDAAFYCLRVNRPLDRLSAIPTLADGDLTLDALLPSDAPDYRLLCLETRGTDYGFTYDFDPEGDGGDLVDAASAEFISHVALPFAVRCDARLVGELTLFAFDGKGGYEIAVRILPAARRRGIARRALEVAMRYARDALGCPHPRAEVKTTNAPSLALFSSLFPKREEKEDLVLFYK